MAAPIFNNIPEELKSRAQSVLWKFKTRGEKITKVPFRTNGNEADSADPQTWTAYFAVVDAYQKGGYEGIGFVFDVLDPYAGVDLDHCINADGTIKPTSRSKDF